VVGLVYFFCTKAFLILAIVTVKIVYLSFLASRANKITLIMSISRVLNKSKLFLVSYADSYLFLSLVLILDLGSGSLSIFFIVEY